MTELYTNVRDLSATLKNVKLQKTTHIKPALCNSSTNAIFVTPRYSGKISRHGEIDMNSNDLFSDNWSHDSSH